MHSAQSLDIDGTGIGGHPFAARDLIVRRARRGDLELSFVIDPWTQRWAILAAGAEAVLRAADGSRSFSAVVAHVVSRSQTPALRDPQTVTGLMLDLLERGILSISRRAHGERGIPVYNTAPLVGLHLEITNACNLRCRHCYVSSGTKLADELTDEELRAVVDQVPQTSSSAVVISGGEPTVRKGCLDFVEYCTLARGHHVDLYTNGYKLTAKFAARILDISARSDRRLRLQISLEGASAQTNDLVRGSGTFARTTASLKLLQDHGLTRSTTIFICLTRSNIAELEEMIALCERYDVSHLHLSQWQRQGNARDIPWATIAPDLGDWIAAGERVLRHDNPRLTVTGNFFGDLKNTQEGDFTLDHALFPKHLYFYNAFPRVSPDGMIFADQFWTSPDWSLGNVREMTLAEAFQSPRFEEQMKLFASRLARVPECQACEWAALCECGSPGHTYAEYGHLWAKDLFCDARIVWFERYLDAQIDRALGGFEGQPT
jgi:radical SAM protein with 4Fe4S-binding SPASM domain